MLQRTTESNVICRVCEQPAIRRTVEVVWPGKGGRQVSYDRHEADTTSAEFRAAEDRLDAFHGRLFDLLSELNRLQKGDKKLSSGQIIRFDADTVHPEACEVRSVIIPTAEIQAFSQTVGVTGKPMGLEGATVEIVLANLKEVAEVQVTKLRQLRNEGEI
jgi:hypothetical protein